MVFIVAFVPLRMDLHKITINAVAFNLHFDQILHSIVYLMIPLYYLVGQYLGMTIFNDNSFLKFLFAIFFLAIVTEIIQIFVPSRAFNFFDLVANLFGVLIGLLITKCVRIAT
jgi:VanZ family protein